MQVQRAGGRRIIFGLSVAALAAVMPLSMAAPQARPASREPAAPPATNRTPNNPMDRAAEGAQVFVDDSFASVDQLRTANRYASQGQSQLAIKTYQEIIDKFGQKLVYLNDNSYVSITDYVHERLLAMPALKEGLYDQMYGGDAEREIGAALPQRDAAGLLRACDRFFPSTAAYKGLSQAADWYFERGEFTAAARTWQQMLAHPQGARNRAVLLFRAASAQALAGNAESARDLRDRLQRESPDAQAVISGASTKLLAKLDEILATPPWEPVALGGDEWPAFGGGPGRSGLLNVNSSIGARLWAVPLVEEKPATPGNAAAGAAGFVNGPVVVGGGVMIRGNTVALGGDSDTAGLVSHPVLSNGELFIDTGERVLCLSANAGTVHWTYPGDNQVLARTDPGLEMQVRYSGFASRPNFHDSAAVSGDQVFAVLPAPAAPIQPGVVYSGSWIASSGSTRVVCLSRDNGHEIWSCPAGKVTLDAKGVLAFVGSPLVTRQGVFVMARKSGDTTFSQLYLIRLDRATGNVSWSCYLCSNSVGNGVSIRIGNPQVLGAPIAIPTMVDDVLYISSGAGADCAVDANAGRILWLRITDAVPSPPQYATASWRFNPPLVYRDKLLTADGGGLHVYDRWNGRLLARLGPTDLDGLRVDVMAGAVGPRLIVSGTNQGHYEVRCLNLDMIEQTSRPEWVSAAIDIAGPEGIGAPQGRPFLTATTYYIPAAKKLARIDLRTGKLIDTLPWPNTDRDDHGTPVPGKPGNLLVTSEQVVVVNDAEVAGYSRWETALANRQAKIAAAPNDPEPYLALAEISFRTNHWDLAQENMKKSVDLANAPQATAGRDVLRRLYRTNLTFAEQLLAKSDEPLRDASRFYFEQCRAAARDPDQQAEWRLRLSDLSMRQKKLDEAAVLCSEVLGDPALRAAPYHYEGDKLTPAGVRASSRLGEIRQSAPAVYQRFEDQASDLLQKALAQNDLAQLQRVIDCYPNASAAVAAARRLAAGYRETKDWPHAVKALQYVLAHASGEQRATVIADLATTYMQWGDKYHHAAAAYAARGQSAFKDFSWTDPAGRKVTFAMLREQLGADIGGRLPHLPQTSAPNLQPTVLPQQTLASRATLLPPIETATALRPPNLLFMQQGESLRIYDTNASADVAGSPFHLPQAQPAVLLGCVRDTAILMQSNMVIGLNLKTAGQTWTQRLDGSPVPPRQPQRVNGPAVVRQLGGGQIIIQDGGQLMVNGGNVIINGQLVTFDGTMLPQPALAALDPEAARIVAFARLRPNFSTARILDDTLLVVSGDKLDAYDVATGKPAWRDRSDNRVTAPLPPGQITALLGNQDLIVVQIDSGEPAVHTFQVFDAASGAFRKQIKLSGENPLWRAVADDGTLFVVTDQAVAAYDLLRDSNDPAWRRTDLQTRYPSATALTLDGLIYVDSSLNIMCLSLDGGETAWPRDPEAEAKGQKADLRMQLPASQGQVAGIRSWVDGDRVYLQSEEGLDTYLTAPVPRGPAGSEPQGRWDGAYPPGTPPRQALQFSDQYLVEYATGPAGGAQNAVWFVLHNRVGGKLRGWVPLTRSAVEPPVGGEGPNVRNWQVIDNGIVFEVAGNVMLARIKAD